MSGTSPSPTHKRRRQGNLVSDSEFNDWFDPDGRLVKEAAMREAIFHCECSQVVYPQVNSTLPIASTSHYNSVHLSQ